MRDLTPKQRSEARHCGRRVMKGQVYCRDARTPDMTFREMLDCYHRWVKECARMIRSYPEFAS